jgi:uncharacterized damage-inducible protein DinB
MNVRDLLIDTYTNIPPASALAALDEGAALRKIPGAPHSIAEIVAHMNFWQIWFTKRCSGDAEPMAATASLGWPPASPGCWDSLRDQFLAGLEAAAAVAGDNPIRPVDPPIEFPPLANYTVQEALVHLAMHNAHHLGQIVTLRQLMGLWPPPSGSWTW